MSAAREVCRAVGIGDGFGFSQVGGHAHCNSPGVQQGGLDGFVGRFLRGRGNGNGTAGLGIWRSRGAYEGEFSQAKWIPWKGLVPSLSVPGSSTTSTSARTTSSSTVTGSDPTMTSTSTTMVTDSIASTIFTSTSTASISISISIPTSPPDYRAL